MMETILDLFDADQRFDIQFFGMRREETPLVVRHVPTEAALGFVLYSRLTPENADDAIREEIAYFDALAKPFEWKLYEHDRPADLLSRLRGFGFAVGEPETVMVLDLTSRPEALLARDGADVRRVFDRGTLEAVDAVHGEVWGDKFSSLLDELWRELEGDPDHLSVYLAYADGEPACAAWLRFSEGSLFASLWGGSTRPRFRGRGLYTATVAARAREAVARGVRYLTVDASSESRPILERLGFRPLVTTYPCQWGVRDRAE